MTKNVVVTLKIRPTFFELIRSGLKTYEIRDSSLEGADIICFLDAETGNFLGSFSVGDVYHVNRSKDPQTIERSGIDVNVFYELFPPVQDGGPSELWVAQLRERIDLSDALGIG